MIIGSGSMPFSAPMIADLYHRHQHERLNELFKISTKWACISHSQSFWYLRVYAEDILRVVFGLPMFEELRLSPS